MQYCDLARVSTCPPTSNDVSDCFSWAKEAGLTVPYRDATFSVPDFGLTLLDCWRGLEKGRDRALIEGHNNLSFRASRVTDSLFH